LHDLAAMVQSIIFDVVPGGGMMYTFTSSSVWSQV